MKQTLLVTLVVFSLLSLIVVAGVWLESVGKQGRPRLNPPTSFERVVMEQAGSTLNSIPLAVAILDSLTLAGPVFIFDEDTRGRALSRARWVAVERYFYTLPPDSTRQYDFQAISRLAEDGQVSDTTRVLVWTKRALVRGDSAQVAEHLEKWPIAWYVSPDWEPAPSNPIVPPDPNATCGYTPPDSTAPATPVP